MPHQLFLFRHAKSDWRHQCEDVDRPLSKRGIQDAINMGAWMLEEKLIPDRILTSPAERSVQTCDYLMQGFQGMLNCPAPDKRLYHASVEKLVEIISEQHESIPSLMLVGHNPEMDSLLEFLFGEDLPLTAKGKLMTTASLAVIELQESWEKFDTVPSILQQITRPKFISSQKNH